MDKRIFWGYRYLSNNRQHAIVYVGDDTGCRPIAVPANLTDGMFPDVDWGRPCRATHNLAEALAYAILDEQWQVERVLPLFEQTLESWATHAWVRTADSLRETLERMLRSKEDYKDA